MLAVAGRTSQGTWQIHLYGAEQGSIVAKLNTKHPVQALDFHPNGKQLVSAGGQPDGESEVILWDVSTGTHIGTLNRHAGAVNCVAYSPSGHSIVTGGEDREIHLWSAEDFAWQKTLMGSTGPVRCLAFNSDEQRLAASCGGSMVRVWNLTEDGPPGWELEAKRFKAAFRAVAFEPARDGLTFGLVASCGALGIGRVIHWDVSKKPVPQEVPADLAVGLNPPPPEVPSRQLGSLNLGSLAFSPDGRTLVGGDVKGRLHIWDLHQYDQPKALLVGHATRVGNLAFSDAGDLLVSGDARGVVRFWQAPLWEDNQQRYLAGQNADRPYLMMSSGEIGRNGPRRPYYQRIAFDPQRPHLAGIGVTREYRELRRDGITIPRKSVLIIWDVRSGAVVQSAESQQETFQDLTYSADGNHLAVATSASDQWFVRVADLTKPIRGVDSFVKVHSSSDPISSIDMSPGGKTLVVAGGELPAPGGVTLIDLPRGEPIALLEDTRGRVKRARFCRQGRLMAVAVGGAVSVIEVGSRKLLRRIDADPKSVNDVAYSPDGKRLVTAGDDQTARIWSVADGKLLQTFQGHEARVTHARFMPDATRLVTGSVAGKTKLWDPDTGQELLTFADGSGAIRSLAVHNVGYVATVKASNVTSGAWIHVFDGRPLDA